MSIVRTMECAFDIENKFLSLMIVEAEKQIARTDFDGKEIRDMADNVYQIKISQAQVFDSKEKIDLLDIKKHMLVWDFQKIEEPNLVDRSSQVPANAKYNQLLIKRKNKIEELKGQINKSKLLAKVFCVYLARSNYPQKNSFEILPRELEQFFDSERKSSKHLKKVKILDSILEAKGFKL